MKWLIAVAVLALCWCLSLRTALGIECYVCSSYNDTTGCSSDHVDKHYLVNCTERKGGVQNTMCRRIRQWIDFDVLGMKSNERVFRTCGHVETTRECYYRAGFGGRQEVCTCRDRGCNAAPRPLLGAPVLMMLLLLVGGAVGARHAV